jgi:two-component system sensor histidine kinase SenX3
MLDAGDAGHGTVAVIQDITERHRIDAVRRDFVANVSHELRTPIGALTALADTLSAEDEPEVMRRLASRIAAEAERAGHLIDDLLDLSRIESGEVHRRAVAVGELVAKARERVGALAADRSISLHTNEPVPDATVLVDSVQVVSALSNLLENGVKYSEAGTVVRLTAALDASALTFEVRDEGIGIPPSDRDRIFERFYRVDPARSRATGGTGLGLAIVRHVARNHGGDVQVESREGEGSTFTLRLPQPGPTAVGGAA